jgi:tRNA(His) 5'-end guanylyltransferase
VKPHPADKWITLTTNEYMEDWRNANDVEWEDAMWGNPFKLAEQGLNKTGKTIIFGHFHTSYAYSKYEGFSEFGEDAKFDICTFDCRIIPLPNKERVVDCFLWRQEDANRNALNGWCYWTLRKEGESKHKATSILSGKGNDFKNELLFQKGINYNDVPSWQKRGIGFVFEEVEKEGMNPITGEKVKTKRRELVEKELPIGEEYRKMILKILN